MNIGIDMAFCKNIKCLNYVRDIKREYCRLIQDCCLIIKNTHNGCPLPKKCPHRAAQLIKEHPIMSECKDCADIKNNMWLRLLVEEIKNEKGDKNGKQ